jgi:1,4-alpha-glucan branching enzyme
MTQHLAIVLHAHLPWVLGVPPSAPISFEEAWLHEAIWESYVPLLRVLESWADAGGAAALTLSLSPTLLAMLASESLGPRFAEYAEGARAHFARARRAHPEWVPAIADHEARLEDAVAAVAQGGGRLLAPFVALAERRVIELGTTAATHAHLPSLLTAASARAQIRVGLRYFRELTGRHARFFWLPECGFAPRLAPLLVDSGAECTVLDTHAIELAEPRSTAGTFSPVVAHEPFAYFARDRELCRAVWSSEVGYPGASEYRDFHAVASRGTPFELALKPLRVTGDGPKSPYDPRLAHARADRDAADFLSRVDRALAAAPSSAREPVATVAFDAELFGHWWWEGPRFLEQVLRGASGRPWKLATPTGLLDADTELVLTQPATSSWGRGGFSEVWSHPRVSHALRLVHRAERRVLAVDVTVRDQPRTEVQRAARLLAIRALLELQSSDLLFMLRTGQAADYAESRVRELAATLDVLCEVALRPREEPGDRGIVATYERRPALFLELEEDALADCFDPL